MLKSMGSDQKDVKLESEKSLTRKSLIKSLLNDDDDFIGYNSQENRNSQELEEYRSTQRQVSRDEDDLERSDGSGTDHSVSHRTYHRSFISVEDEDELYNECHSQFVRLKIPNDQGTFQRWEHAPSTNRLNYRDRANSDFSRHNLIQTSSQAKKEQQDSSLKKSSD